MLVPVITGETERPRRSDLDGFFGLHPALRPLSPGALDFAVWCALVVALYAGWLLVPGKLLMVVAAPDLFIALSSFSLKVPMEGTTISSISSSMMRTSIPRSL